MARYTGPTARRWRRLGATPPDGSGVAVQRRNYPPGQHGLRRGAKQSEYGTQLKEKQKAKYTYGVLEKQFRRYYGIAARKDGMTGENLMRLLELRLDNVIFRLGLAATRAQARQTVSHGHVKVNGQKVDIPSYEVSEGDEIALTDKLKKVVEARGDKDAATEVNVPIWLKLDAKSLNVKVLSAHKRSEIDAAINEQLIVEFYSR
jgi:small subunit ribosomal protein S4